MSLHYVPAGVEAYYNQGTQLLVSKHSEPNLVEETTDFGIKYKRWNTREKKLVLSIFSPKGGVNVKEKFDVCVPIFNASFIQACGLTKVLANPVHKPFKGESFTTRKIETIIDSGGFQLLKSTVDFVDPNDVVREYNENASIGMPLDLPMEVSMEKTYFDAVSKLIRANDKFILERLNKDVHLALISHGTSLELRKRRLDVLDRETEAIAIAGLNIDPRKDVDHIQNIVENLMYVLHRYRKTARYFHVLGVTSKMWMFVYAVIDALKFVREIGADSVSHRLSALAGLYETEDFRTIQLAKDQKHRASLGCNCPVCFAVDDLRIMNHGILLEAHTLWVRARQAELMSELAHSYIKGHITLKSIHEYMQLRVPLHKFSYIIKYVQEIAASGVYKPIKPMRDGKTLFDAVKTTSKGSAKSDHVHNVIRKYEKFHRTKFL